MSVHCLLFLPLQTSEPHLDELRSVEPAISTYCYVLLYMDLIRIRASSPIIQLQNIICVFAMFKFKYFTHRYTYNWYYGFVRVVGSYWIPWKSQRTNTDNTYLLNVKPDNIHSDNTRPVNAKWTEILDVMLWGQGDDKTNSVLTSSWTTSLGYCKTYYIMWHFWKFYETENSHWTIWTPWSAGDR